MNESRSVKSGGTDPFLGGAALSAEMPSMGSAKRWHLFAGGSLPSHTEIRSLSFTGSLPPMPGQSGCIIRTLFSFAI